MARPFTAPAFLAAFLVSLSTAAGEEPSARVLFVRGQSLLSTPASGRGEVAEVATLPAGPGQVTWMEASSDARVVLLGSDSGDQALWVEPREGSTTAAAAVPCAGRARLAPSGRCLVCPEPPAAARVVRLRSGRSRAYAIPSALVTFLGPAGRELVAAGSGGIWAYSLGKKARPRLLAPHGPLRSLAPSPDGKRAVAVYDQEDAPTLDSFRLDGKAPRRTLMRDAEPVAWSADSEWLLVEQEGRACIVRAVGGQYKCWRGFVGAAIAGDGGYAILARSTVSEEDGKPGVPATYDLYRAELAGADASRPVRLVEGATSPAALVWTPPH